MFTSAMLITLALAITQQTDADGEAQHNAEMEWERLMDARDYLAEELFDPDNLLPFPSVDGSSRYAQVTIKVTYTGDDYAWPVYAFAMQIYHDCVHPCSNEWAAWMNRAPVPIGRDATATGFRARWRGNHLVNVFADQLDRMPMASRYDLANALTIERVEANSETCIDIWPHMNQLTEMRWLDPVAMDGLLNNQPDRILIEGHSDRVNVTIDGTWSSAGSTRASPRQGTVAGWADDLVDLLEDCWQPRD